MGDLSPSYAKGGDTVSISAAYATPVEYRRVVGMTDAGLDAEIEADLRAVSRYIDGEMRRHFTRDATPTVRVYVPTEATRLLMVDDLSAAPTQIRIDTSGNGTFATTLQAADFELLPQNAPNLPEPWPFTQVRLTSWGRLGVFPANQRVEVTARFGWPQVPQAIQRATIQIAALLRLETPRATKRIGEMNENVETSYQAQNIVRQLTNQYRVWLV